MKANELVVGKKYWCGKTEKIAVFRDICDCYIECNVEQVERWVSER